MPKTAIINAKIYTVNSTNQVFHSGTILFDGDVILDIGPTESTSIPQGTKIIDGKNRLAVLPGLIDIHSHSSLLKGFSENLPFLDWLPEYQREHKVLDEDDAYWAAMVSYLEALKGGTTCVLDMYRFMHRCAEAAGELGIRAHLAPYVADVNDHFESLDKNEKLIKTHHESYNGRIKIMVGLEHLFYCSEAAYKRARSLSDYYDVFIHTHTSEFKEEVEAVRNYFGKRPIHIFKERGILTPKTIIAHCIWLDSEEITIMADHDSRIAHCPTSNVKLGGGTLELDKIMNAQIKFGLGTDGSISNNSLSMWEVMKFGSLLQKNVTMDACALNAEQVLRLATIEAAKVLGQDHLIGSLEKGKKGDFITVNLWQPHLMPIATDDNHDPVLWNLIYAGRASDVQDVWVNGQQVIQNGKSTLLNEAELLEKVHKQTLQLLAKRRDVSSTNFIQPKHKNPSERSTSL